jgi:hypothetical protein
MIGTSDLASVNQLTRAAIEQDLGLEFIAGADAIRWCTVESSHLFKHVNSYYLPRSLTNK